MLSGEATNINCIVFGFILSGLKPTIYYYTTDTVGLIGSGTQKLAINTAKMESFFSNTLLAVCPLPEQIKSLIVMEKKNTFSQISNYYRQKDKRMSKYT